MQSFEQYVRAVSKEYPNLSVEEVIEDYDEKRGEITFESDAIEWMKMQESIMQHMREGKLLPAIKELRNMKALGLVEARDHIIRLRLSL